MNNILFFSPEDHEANQDLYMQRIGDFMLCVYGNSLNTGINEVENGAHPEVATIIKRCYTGKYASVQEVQKDFNPIFFKARINQDDRPQVAAERTGSNMRTVSISELEDQLVIPDHPDTPSRPFLLTREHRIGRRGKRSKKRQATTMIVVAILIVFLGVLGVSRLWNREAADETAQVPPVVQVPPVAPAPQVPVETPTDPNTNAEAGTETGAEITEPEAPSAALPGNEASPPTAEPPAPYTTYTIQAGDTLFAISRRFYGDGGLFREIMTFNNITDATALRVGQVIRIPRR